MIRNLPAKSALALIALATLAAHAAAQAPQSASVGSLPAQGAPARAARHPPTSHPAATAWTRQESPDCTSTVELPDGWRFVDGDAPGVWIQGPGNETLVLGSRKFMKPGEADYMLPEQALAWFARNRGVELQGIQSLQPLKITFAGEYETMVAQAEGPQVRALLLRRFRADSPSQNAPAGSTRTAAQLWAAAGARKTVRVEAEAQARRVEAERVAAAKAAAYNKRLDQLATRTEAAWQEIADLIETKKPHDYDQAVSLLRDLSALARRDGDHDSFTARFLQLRSRHERKPSLQERFDKAGLPRYP